MLVESNRGSQPCLELFGGDLSHKFVELNHINFTNNNIYNGYFRLMYLWIPCNNLQLLEEIKIYNNNIYIYTLWADSYTVHCFVLLTYLYCAIVLSCYTYSISSNQYRTHRSQSAKQSSSITIWNISIDQFISKETHRYTFLPYNKIQQCIRVMKTHLDSYKQNYSRKVELWSVLVEFGAIVNIVLVEIEFVSLDLNAAAVTFDSMWTSS